jgi:hypothetical protein
MPSFVRSHPVIVAIFAVCTLAGAALGLAFSPDEWALVRRAAAGGVSGAGIALLITATRLMD